MNLTARWDDITHELEAGLVAAAPDDPFVLDPEIKEEYVFIGQARKPSTTVADRAGTTATLLSGDGEKRRITSLNPAESVVAQVGEPQLYPELSEVRRRMEAWRFYHQFDTSSTSEIRRPKPGIRTDALASDGSDLAAAVATLAERGDKGALDDAVSSAFPGCQVTVGGAAGTFAIEFHTGFQRPLTARELSDGQLRFLCLATALLATRPPELLVLNEPETSLHDAAVEALAPLILSAAQYSQVWVTTHDDALLASLGPSAMVCGLELLGGETHVVAAE